MGKKQVNVSLRKPPATDPDTFVSGPDQSTVSLVPRSENASEGPTVLTRVGERREVTLYLPVALARELSIRCVELNRDISSFVAESLTVTLSADSALGIAPPLSADPPPVMVSPVTPPPLPPVTPPPLPLPLPLPGDVATLPALDSGASAPRWSRFIAHVRARMPRPFGAS